MNYLVCLSTEKANVKIIKICLVGSENSGKTNIRRLIIGKRFKRGLSPTIGSDFSFSDLRIDKSEFKPMIWDLSGNNKYKSGRSLYLQGTQGAFLVFDITDYSSFQQLNGWVDEIIQNTTNKRGIPLLILANKTDLIPFSDNVVSESQIKEFINELRKRFDFQIDIDYILTSASTGENIDLAIRKMIGSIQKWDGVSINQLNIARQ